MPLYLPNSPTRCGISVPCVIPNFTYTVRYINALPLTNFTYMVGYIYAPPLTKFTYIVGTLMPYLSNKLRLHCELYLCPSPYQVYLHAEVYFCPVPVPYSTQTPPTNIPNTIFCTVKQNHTIHALACLQAVVSHPAGMSRNQFGCFSKICYPSIIWEYRVAGVSGVLSLPNFVASILCMLIECCLSAE